MNKKLFEQALAAKTPEELLKVARENGIPELTEEKAKEYFGIINHKSGVKSGELADEEMDVSAGGCCALRAHGQKMVSALNSCGHYKCGPCNGKISPRVVLTQYLDEAYLRDCDRKKYDPNDEHNHSDSCGDCYYCSYERGAWWCNNKIHYNE